MSEFLVSSGPIKSKTISGTKTSTHMHMCTYTHTANFTAATKISKSMFQTHTTLILYCRKETLRKLIMQNF